MTDTLLKNYIHSVDISESLRSKLTFSDAAKIRMYSDERRGVRLKPWRYNKFAVKVEFLVYDATSEVTVRLPEWSPQAVKGWGGFEEVSSKPTGTAINWRVSNGTDDYWWTGAAWAVVTPLATEWNTEIEISANIGTFPHIQKTIHFIARLETTDRWKTPVLLGTRLLVTASFDWFEDLILDSLKPRIEEDFTFLMDWSGVLQSATDRFNVKTDYEFTPEENLNIVGIESVYNDDTDPGYETDLLSSFDTNTGLAILTGLQASGTRLFFRLNVAPVVAINFTNSDYDEVGSTPAVIIDRIDVVARQVKATAEMALKDRDEGVKLDQPLWVEHLRCSCVLLTGSLVSSLRLMTQAYAFVVRGATQQSGHPIGSILKTNALDLEHTLKITPLSRYNPKSNFSDLKESSFEITVCNFYAWLRDMETKPLVSNFNYSVADMKDAGTGSPNDTVTPLPGGAIPALFQTPEVEEV